MTATRRAVLVLLVGGLAVYWTAVAVQWQACRRDGGAFVQGFAPTGFLCVRGAR